MRTLSILLATSLFSMLHTPVEMCIRTLFNLLFTFGVIHFLYYRKSKRIDYYVTFLLMSTAIFMIIYLLSGIKLKMGFAMGLFAVFGIIRYRTISMPVREMTYLFVLITMSVINALGVDLGWPILILSNIVFVLLIIVCEIMFAQRKGVKYIKYDRIDLCKKSRKKEMISDIEERLGIKVINVYIGSVNFLKDMALVKVYYEPDEDDVVDEEIIKMPKD